MPGDKIQIINSNLYINDIEVKKNKIKNLFEISCGGNLIDVDFYEETLPNGKQYISVYRKEGSMINSDLYVVPEDHYFFMGDNRDCSKDSRYLSSVGYVSFTNLVGKAQVIFFSNNKEEGSFFKIWKWNKSVRSSRFFKNIN